MSLKKLKNVLLLAIPFLITGCFDSDPKTEIEKQSYAAGVRMAETLHSQTLNLDYRMVSQGIKDVTYKQKLRLSEQEIKAAQLNLAQAVDQIRMKEASSNLKETEKKVDSYIKQKGVRRTDSGLAYKIIIDGRGARPTASDTVVVDYTGKLMNDLVFDSSVQRGKPAEFQLNNIIPGLAEVLKMMRVGSHYEVLIPPGLAYGPSGNANIPSNSALIFDLELKSIKK